MHGKSWVWSHAYSGLVQRGRSLPLAVTQERQSLVSEFGTDMSGLKRRKEEFGVERVEACLCDVTRRLGYSELTPYQQEAVLKFVSGTDVLVVLPTGSGKSICFAALPWMFDALRGHMFKSVVVVIAPLNSLMQDQVLSLSRKGLKAAFISASTISEDPDLSTRVAIGEYQLVYIEPEIC